MSWYTVTKTIKGRKYLYRQRTWRQNGKMRTNSVYLGPTGDYGGGGAWRITPSSRDSHIPQTINIQDNTTNPVGLVSLDAFQLRSTTQYTKLERAMQDEFAIGRSVIGKALYLAIRGGQWKRLFTSVLSDMQTYGGDEVMKQAKVELALTEKRLNTAENKLTRLRDPVKIKKQRRLIRRLRIFHRRTGRRYAAAMWGRIYMLDKRPT